MPPNPETGLVTLPEAVTGNLARKFGEISLFDQHADFELVHTIVFYISYIYKPATSSHVKPGLFETTTLTLLLASS
jgi:hypothetical protein